MVEESGFIKRWSHQKLKSSPGDENPVAAIDPAQEPVVAEALEATEAPAPDLPDIESLDKESDFTAFLGKNVPEKLARMALRKLWLSDPVLANVDGLNDYDDDFTIASGGGESMAMKGAVETVLETVRSDGADATDDADPEAADGEPEAGDADPVSAAGEGDEGDGVDADSPDPQDVHDVAGHDEAGDEVQADAETVSDISRLLPDSTPPRSGT